MFTSQFKLTEAFSETVLLLCQCNIYRFFLIKREFDRTMYVLLIYALIGSAKGARYSLYYEDYEYDAVSDYTFDSSFSIPSRKRFSSLSVYLACVKSESL